MQPPSTQATQHPHTCRVPSIAAVRIERQLSQRRLCCLAVGWLRQRLNQHPGNPGSQGRAGGALLQKASQQGGRQQECGAACSGRREAGVAQLGLLRFGSRLSRLCSSCCEDMKEAEEASSEASA